MNWFRGLSVAWRLTLLAITAVLLLVAYNFVDDLFSKEDEVRAELSENQADAAIESGVDAVNTVTTQHTREVERHETVRIIEREVNDAKDFDSAHDAGSRGLCDHFGVCSEERMQQPDSNSVQATSP
jgi:hypothetical protein